MTLSFDMNEDPKDRNPREQERGGNNGNADGDDDFEEHYDANIGEADDDFEEDLDNLDPDDPESAHRLRI